MPATRLTDVMLRTVRCPYGRVQIDLYDTVVRGLSARISKGGAKAFSFKYREGSGRERRLTLGRYPDLSLAEARVEAQTLRSKIAKGENLKEDSSAKLTLAAAAEEFLRRYSVKNRSHPETARLLEREVTSKLGTRPLGDVTKSDILRLIEAIEDRGAPVLARNVFAVIRKFYRWCFARDYVTRNPTAGLEAPRAPAARTRVLNHAEFSAVWRAASMLGHPGSQLVQLLIITAQRRDQIAELRWSWIDFTKAEVVFPSSVMKNKREFVVPLSGLALSVLHSIPRYLDDDRVFPSRSQASAKCFSGFSKIKQRLDQISGVNDWRLHDLRRVASTNMNAIGIAPIVVDSVLSHTVRGVSGVYNRHHYLDEKRSALNRWAEIIMKIEEIGT